MVLGKKILRVTIAPLCYAVHFYEIRALQSPARSASDSRSVPKYNGIKSIFTGFFARAPTGPLRKLGRIFFSRALRVIDDERLPSLTLVREQDSTSWWASTVATENWKIYKLISCCEGPPTRLKRGGPLPLHLRSCGRMPEAGISFGAARGPHALLGMSSFFFGVSRTARLPRHNTPARCPTLRLA